MSDKRKRGGQPGNRNAAGHGAPIGNRNAYKHGLYAPFYPMILFKAGVSLDRYDKWFWGNIEKLGYTREEMQSYRGHGSDGGIQLYMRETPGGTPEPGKVVVYRGKSIVFDSSKCAVCDHNHRQEQPAPLDRQSMITKRKGAFSKQTNTRTPSERRKTCVKSRA